MKLGVVGHRRTIEMIVRVAHTFFEDVETSAIEFEDISQISLLVKTLKTQEKFYDGLLFTGPIPYEYMNKAMISHKPWGYIKRNHSQLTRALLEAIMVYQYDILNLSIDFFNRSTVHQVYKDIGIKADLSRVYALENIELDLDLIQRLATFHLDNYFKRQVSVCITGISSIYERLADQKVPCMMIDPSEEHIKETIQTLKYKYETKISEERHIVALSIEIDNVSDFSLINENEYQVMLNKMKVTEEVYKFAQRIQAAVIEIGLTGYLLFSTKNILEIETNCLQELNFLKSVSEKSAYTISLGIGYGITAREAKYNANQGMIRARQSGGNKAFTVQDGQFMGPILGDKLIITQEDKGMDGLFYRIAKETGLSANNVFKLFCVIKQQKKDCFTSRELAHYMNLSSRSVNRIVNKLESRQYAEVVGAKMLSQAGRPSRIIRFKIK